jgi:hypothetical protein
MPKYIYPKSVLDLLGMVDSLEIVAKVEQVDYPYDTVLVEANGIRFLLPKDDITEDDKRYANVEVGDIIKIKIDSY